MLTQYFASVFLPIHATLHVFNTAGKLRIISINEVCDLYLSDTSAAIDSMTD